MLIELEQWPDGDSILIDPEHIVAVVDIGASVSEPIGNSPPMELGCRTRIDYLRHSVLVKQSALEIKELMKHERESK